MSQWPSVQNEAGPSSGSLHYDPPVRRCKTVSYAASFSSSTHPRPRATASNKSSLPTLQQLALPIRLDNASRRSSSALSELRDPTVSPSKRGETLRAYSRQRRVFSDNENAASASPDRLGRAQPLASPALASTRRPPPARNYAGGGGPSDSIGCSLLFSNAPDDSQSGSFAPLPLYSQTETLMDEASSSMSSTPSLTSPTSTLSRSTSLRSAGSDRTALRASARYLSLNGSADLPTTIEGLSPEYGAFNWTRRARRWSNSMSRRMSITALNQTLHSTTSPYLKAGLQELRSIFDVDTLGVAVGGDDEREGTDLEGASPTKSRETQLGAQGPSGFFNATSGSASASAMLCAQAVFESPEAISPVLSRQSSSDDRELATATSANRPSISFKSQLYEAPVAHRRPQSWRKHRSLSISDLPDRSLLLDSNNDQSCASSTQKSSSGVFAGRREASVRFQSVRTPMVAVGLAALSVSIIGVCAFETSIHPDAASLPLTAFMLAQSAFALVGIAGLVLQKRWVIDLASRLIRAHVLCQVLIALAALRSLSRTAFYRDRIERQKPNGTTAGADMLTSSNLLAPPSQRLDPHMSLVGSFRDQLTYVCVFIVQAAAPLACLLCAQYSIASALSRATRHLPAPTGSNKEHNEQRQYSVPAVKVADADRLEGPRNERMRFNSEDPSLSKSSSQSTLHCGATQRSSEGWLGFVITRLDTNKAAAVAPPKFDLDADDLTRRLQALARSETPTQ